MKKIDLLKLIQQQKIPHALLFCGGNSVEKKAFALSIARELLGDKWMDDLSHPDLLILPHEENTVIGIDNVREASIKLNQTAHQGGYKIIIFNSAEAMPLGAMNALLKTLEEPSQNSILILITENAGLLPLTIQSRCQKVMFENNKNNNNTELFKLILINLKKLQQNELNVIDAAKAFEKIPLEKMLDELYYCAGYLIQRYDINLFDWFDLINDVRQKIIKKYNPNQLLTLEAIFYHWTTYDARRFTLPPG